MSEKMFECTCFGHSISVSAWAEGVIINIWDRASGGAWLLKYRLRHIWHIIKHGAPQSAGEVILTPDDARELGRHLIEQADKVAIRSCETGVEPYVFEQWEELKELLPEPGECCECEHLELCREKIHDVFCPLRIFGDIETAKRYLQWDCETI